MRTHVVTGQQDMVDLLNSEGVECDQSSVSRDLRELGAIKAGGRYAIPSDSGLTFLSVHSVKVAGPNLLVLKTAVGAANLVAVDIDKMDIPEIVGTIAGDDTIFLATASAEAQKTVLGALGLVAS